MAQEATIIAAEQTALTVVRNQPLFAGMEANLQEAFAQASQLQSLPKGAVLFLQDDPADWFYVIVNGWVKLFTETLDGNEAVIDMLSNSNMVGDSAILEDGVHTFGAATIEPVTLLRIPSGMLKSAIQEDHKVALSMLGALSRHRKRQTREIESLTLQNASQRIGCFLLRLCHPGAEEPLILTLPYDKSLIAARLGMKSETFSRALNKLRGETSISIKGTNVTIPDIEELSTYVCTACSNEFPCADLGY